jgi:hypothetical protein
MSARSSKDDYLQLRVAVCRSLLGATAHVPRDSLDSQFSLSPTDRLPNRESKSNYGRYDKGLCDGTSW